MPYISCNVCELEIQNSLESLHHFSLHKEQGKFFFVFSQIYFRENEMKIKNFTDSNTFFKIEIFSLIFVRSKSVEKIILSRFYCRDKTIVLKFLTTGRHRAKHMWETHVRKSGHNVLNTLIDHVSLLCPTYVHTVHSTPTCQ